MKRLTVLLFALLLFSCKSSRHKYDPEAIKLNDSAVALVTNPPVMSKDDSSTMAKINRPAKDTGVKQNTKPYDTIPHVVYEDHHLLYEKAIDLLNKAIQIDSNYFIAYLNKFNFETHLQRYKDALVAAKQMIRLRPGNIHVKLDVGKAYDRVGDSTHAFVFYDDYLLACNSELDTMAESNKNRKAVEINKALALILLGQQQKGHDILKMLYDTESDVTKKPTDSLYMYVTRNNIIFDKEKSVTVGNNSYSISP